MFRNEASLRHSRGWRAQAPLESTGRVSSDKTQPRGFAPQARSPARLRGPCQRATNKQRGVHRGPRLRSTAARPKRGQRRHPQTGRPPDHAPPTAPIARGQASAQPLHRPQRARSPSRKSQSQSPSHPRFHNKETRPAERSRVLPFVQAKRSRAREPLRPMTTEGQKVRALLRMQPSPTPQASTNGASCSSRNPRSTNVQQGPSFVEQQPIP